MRLKLRLVPKEEKCQIPINYQHPLSSAIYKILYSASSEYAKFLHEKGYVSAKGKPLKLFTFSYLYIPHVKVVTNMLVSYGHPICTLLISSPLLEGFIQNLVLGLFENQEITIGTRGITTRFIIKEVEAVAPPEFTENCKFKCLSPFVLSTMKEMNGRLMPYYYRPDDPEISEALRKNLIEKYLAVYKKLPKNENLEFQLDQTYVDRKGGYAKITKLITIKENNLDEMTRIKAILAPFQLSGSIELMKIAWEAGIGGHCSQGFGMVDVV